MNKMLSSLIRLTVGSNPPTNTPKKASIGQLRKLTARDLIRRESRIGGTLFGPVNPGHRREFFCLDPQTWVWYEEWIDPITKERKSITTRYEIHTNGILKAQDGQAYVMLEGEELHNLAAAIRLYKQQVFTQVYHRAVSV